MKRVLVDMDGVLCDFEGQFLQKWREAFPDARWLPLDERQTHYVDFDPSRVYDSARAHTVIKTSGFYETMPPIPGALDGIRQLDALPHVEVCICTAPFGRGESAAKCEREKKAWVKAHLGLNWTSPDKFVCVKDKSGVSGTLLIDDKPEPARSGSASWEHVVFSQPFNRSDPSCSGKPRMNSWDDWQEVVLPLLGHQSTTPQDPVDNDNGGKNPVANGGCTLC